MKGGLLRQGYAEQVALGAIGAVASVVDSVDRAAFDDPAQAERPLPASAPQALRLLRAWWLEYHRAETAEARMRALDGLNRLMGAIAKMREGILRASMTAVCAANQRAINRERLALASVQEGVMDAETLQRLAAAEDIEAE